MIKFEDFKKLELKSEETANVKGGYIIVGSEEGPGYTKVDIIWEEGGKPDCGVDDAEIGLGALSQNTTQLS